jgi:nucleotide-binding universal stress UspA family protein
MIKRDTFNRVEQILVPTDYSTYSFEAFPWAAIFADKFGAKILILHVIHQSTADWMTSIPGNPWDCILKQQDSWMMEYFTSSMDADFNLALEVDTLVRVGHAAPEIIETAKERNTSIIVIGTHGRTGLPHVFLGSVAEKVVRSASCPVFTVKPSSFKKKDETSFDEIHAFLAN